MLARSLWFHPTPVNRLFCLDEKTGSFASDLSRTPTAFFDVPYPSSKVGSHASSFRVHARKGSRNRITKYVDPRFKDGEGATDDDDDALEMLFRELEKDLEEDKLEMLNEDELNSEEWKEFERELELLLSAEDIQEESEPEVPTSDLASDSEGVPRVDGKRTQSEVSSASNHQPKDGAKGQKETSRPNSEAGLDDPREESPEIFLKKWQVVKLAKALEKGRRQVNIKQLASEVGLERDHVLAWMKNPPDLSQLDLSRHSHPQRDDRQAPKGGLSPQDAIPFQSNAAETRQPWSVELQKERNGRKRLKKEHINILEKVFYETKRPSESMIDSIVELTRLPRSRVVEWFDHRRNLDDSKKQKSRSRSKSMNPAPVDDTFVE